MENVLAATDVLTADHISKRPEVSTHVVPEVTTGNSEEYIQRCAEVASRASSADRFTGMLVREKLGVDDITPQDIYSGNLIRLRTKIEQGARIAEAGNFAAVACWEPPEATAPAHGVGDNQTTPMYVEMRALGRASFAEFLFRIETTKKRIFQHDTKYWKLSLMARDPLRPDKGVVRAVVEPWVALAKATGVPIWLEAGSARGRAVYEYFGFRVVEEIDFEKSCRDETGRPLKGTVGITVWLMVCNWPVQPIV